MILIHVKLTILDCIYIFVMGLESNWIRFESKSIEKRKIKSDLGSIKKIWSPEYNMELLSILQQKYNFTDELID